MPASNVLLKIYRERKHIIYLKAQTNMSLLFRSFINVKLNYKQKYR